MNRTRVRRRHAVALGCVTVLAGIWAGPLTHASAGLPPRQVEARRYVVRQGDTIWGIAVRLGPVGDPRPLVDAITEANDVDPGALRPGQTLIVPSV